MTTTLADNFRFLRALIARPKDVGAIMPSSPALAEAIARQIDPKAGPVLELGPGTGVISHAILARGVAPEQLTLLEYDEDLAQHLAARFPKVRVFQGDAFDLDATLGKPNGSPFAAIVSGIPLLNHAMSRRQSLMAGLASRLMPGAPLIQFSYGAQAPVVPPPGYTVIRTASVLANIPPAKVWVYRKA
ncbi:MAG TPA: rRNA adenine N-6-methyltransferase family protein [Rhizomicrobium sp.]|nr:rRNA adenine N-6-methyltransferase family protein [Rhizomicrobium sp.]HKX64686.1 rRNA adenine N-6-methyltransferase family protein [Rhizomicrobium sp.]